jgi:CO/xanthine dehydrogenase Mo-binding subunit
MRPSRREFVKWVSASGIALSVSRLAFAEEPEFAARETLPGRHHWNPAATGGGRVDGVAKVTGAKLYASDFRAADLPGWPANTSHAMLIRAADATHVYAGIDLSRLNGALKPTAVVTASDIDQAGVRVPEFYAGDLLCPVGKTPLYLGQPVALLFFEDFDTFDQARLALRDGPSVLKFAEETGPVTMPNFGAFRFTRVAGPTPDAPNVYSPSQNGWVSPGFFESSGRPIWARLPVPTGQAYAEAADYGEKIRAELEANNPALLVLDSEFDTQSVDPMALEPESGLAWYDAGPKNLNLVISVQSPAEIATAIAYLLGETKAAFKPAHINTNFASCGGGFGGRDHTPFPLYVALAGMFFPNRPVRLANNRFEQFQSGIKRHAFNIKTRIGVDRATGKIVGFASDHALDGGGLVNFSPSVATVAANGALGIYYVPKVDLTTYVFHSRGVTAGSMRGYGSLQSMTALEVLIDETAAALPLDPIEFRRRNALATGGRILAGNTYSVSIRTPEILDKLERHPIWKQRAEEKARAQQAGILVGTGVACVTKNYGTGADSSLGSVEIAPDGQIAIYCDGAEMGNGVGTAAANRVATHLGGVADEVALEQIDKFSPLDLVASGDPYAIDQKTQDAAARNPRWVPVVSSATAASTGAHVGTHAANEAARVVFRFGLWPAALELWGIAPNDPKANAWEKAQWKDRQLVMPGLAPLSLPAVAAKAHARNFVTGAMAHCFSRWAWAQATFPMAGQEWTADIDALAGARANLLASIVPT